MRSRRSRCSEREGLVIEMEWKRGAKKKKKKRRRRRRRRKDKFIFWRRETDEIMWTKAHGSK
jgi:hypothetical protein